MDPCAVEATWWHIINLRPLISLGTSCFFVFNSTTQAKFFIEILSLVSPSALSRVASIIRGSGHLPSPPLSKQGWSIRNVLEAIKFLGVIRFAATYPAVDLLFKLLQSVMPSFSSKRAAHLDFTETKTKKRLNRETNCKDFMTYASSFHSVTLRLR